jgi:hypothetical protein
VDWTSDLLALGFACGDADPLVLRCLSPSLPVQSFDKQMTQLRAVILRIQELRFHRDVSAEYKALIEAVLSGNGLLV